MPGGVPQIVIWHSPRDAEVARHLAWDLERQGVRSWSHASGSFPDHNLSNALAGADALVVLVSPASAHMPQLGPLGAEAQRFGKPVYSVRTAEVSAPHLPAQLVTDAFGPGAEANVARLAETLRAHGGAAAAHPGGPQPPAGAGWGAPPPHGAPPHHGQAKSPLVPILLGVAGVAAIGFGIYQLIDSGVFDSEPSTARSTYSSAPTSSIRSPATTPVAPAAPPLTPATFAGHWTVSGSCSPGFIYTADGRSGVGGYPLTGTYVINGNVMSTRVGNSDPLIYRVTSWDGNSMTRAGVNHPYGDSIRRCP